MGHPGLNHKRFAMRLLARSSQAIADSVESSYCYFSSYSSLVVWPSLHEKPPPLLTITASSEAVEADNAATEQVEAS